MAELASPESWCTGNGTVGSNPTPSARSRGPLTGPRIDTTSHRAFHFCREAPSADPPALRAGIANPCGIRDSSCLFVKGGVPPFHTFPPVRRAANKVRCHLFFVYGSTRVMAQGPGNADLLVGTARRRRAGVRTADQVRWGTGGGKRVVPSAKKRGDGLERRPLVGIARERETRADDAALCRRECRTLSQSRMVRPLTASSSESVPCCDGVGRMATSSRTWPGKESRARCRPCRPSRRASGRCRTRK